MFTLRQDLIDIQQRFKAYIEILEEIPVREGQFRRFIVKCPTCQKKTEKDYGKILTLLREDTVYNCGCNSTSSRSANINKIEYLELRKSRTNRKNLAKISIEKQVEKLHERYKSIANVVGIEFFSKEGSEKKTKHWHVLCKLENGKILKVNRNRLNLSLKTGTKIIDREEANKNLRYSFEEVKATFPSITFIDKLSENKDIRKQEYLVKCTKCNSTMTKTISQIRQNPITLACDKCIANNLKISHITKYNNKNLIAITNELELIQHKYKNVVEIIKFTNDDSHKKTSTRKITCKCGCGQEFSTTNETLRIALQDERKLTCSICSKEKYKISKTEEIKKLLNLTYIAIDTKRGADIVKSKFNISCKNSGCSNIFTLSYNTLLKRMSEDTKIFCQQCL